MQPFRNLISVRDTTSPEPPPAPIALAYDARAFGRTDMVGHLQEQFPQVRFRPLHEAWFADALRQTDLVIAALDAGAAAEVDRFCVNVKASGRPSAIIAVVSGAGIEVTRRLMQEGVGDVLLAPASDTALAVSLERALGALSQEGRGGSAGEVISILKSGGGVGATVIGTQIAALLAQGGSKVCLVDLDIQFGLAATYLDLRNTVTMGEVLSAGASPTEIGFASNLAVHASGARVLAAPPDFMPLEALTPKLVDELVSALRRDFEVVLLDLPGAWTAWSNRALRLSDRILLVSQLSVPHAHLTRRQLALLETQRLGDVPLTLVCNRFGADAPAGVNRRSVEAAIGRPFDAVLPDEAKLVNEAINQGVALDAIRRGTKLGKAFEQLAAGMAPARNRLRGGR